MQAAKKLVLIDPRILEQLKSDREYKQIQKPADVVAKSESSLNIGQVLNDRSLPDDQKVKQYLQQLNRYLNVKKKLPQEEKSASVNWVSYDPTPVTGWSTAKKRQRRRKTPWEA